MTYKLVPASDAVFVPNTSLTNRAYADVAALADGGAVVAYMHMERVEQREWSVRTQRYDADGAVVGEAVVVDTNADGASDDFRPAVTGLEDGGYAVGWRDNDTWDARVRSYDADGTMRGETILDLPPPGEDVDSDTSAVGNGQYSINALDTGGFAFSWDVRSHAYGEDFGGSRTIYSQTFTADGAADGTPSPFLPWSPAYRNYWETVSDSAPLSDGRYVVLFNIGKDTPGNTTDERAVLGRIFDQNGVALTESFMINEASEGANVHPSIAALTDGGFVISWQAEDTSHWRRYDAQGEAVTAQRDLPPGFPHDPAFPQTTVTPMDDGGFLISALRVFPNYVSPATWGQRIDADNEEVDGPFVIKSLRTPDSPFTWFVSAPEYITLGSGKMMGLFEGTRYDPETGQRVDVLLQQFLPDALGTAGDDEMTAAEGGTAIFGRSGNDLLQGLDAADYLDGESGADTLFGGGGDDTLEGGAGNDRLIGGSGNDTLRGGDGYDLLNGTSGNNLLEGDGLSDTVYGGSGDDTIDGGTGNDILWGLAGDDLIFGDLGSDTIVGADGADTINGGGLSDEIHGGNGADFLNGGWGFDRLHGGEGADTFFHLGIRDHGSDWVQDYNAAEGDVLSTDLATTADEFLVQYAHTATADGVRSGDADVMEAFVVYRATGQILWALVDGAGQDAINLQAAPDLVFDIM